MCMDGGIMLAYGRAMLEDLLASAHWGEARLCYTFYTMSLNVTAPDCRTTKSYC